MIIYNKPADKQKAASSEISEMNGKEMGIGAALAYIKSTKDAKEINGKRISEQDFEYIRSLRNRFDYLAARGNEEKIFQSIPENRCECTNQFLSGNVDFFLSFVLLDDDLKLEKFSPRFIKHLNNCFWCFDIFTNVMREYYYTTQSLLGI